MDKTGRHDWVGTGKDAASRHRLTSTNACAHSIDH